MDRKAQKARERVMAAERELQAARWFLDAVESDCNHDWSDPVYTPDVWEAYTTDGDPPGTLGIDWRGPVHVPRQETPKWTRTCRGCGKTEATTRTTERITATPKF